MVSQQILQRMAEQGLRITEQRRSIAKLFADADGYLTPKDVYETLGSIYSGLSFDTVYRNLRVLNDLGVLEQFISEDGIKFKVHCAGHEHHHHLICLSCDRTMPLEYCPMEQLPGVPNDFHIVKHKFEVYGYCSACQPHDSAFVAAETGGASK